MKKGVLNHKTTLQIRLWPIFFLFSSRVAFCRHIQELVDSANEHLAIACPDLNLRVICQDAQKLTIAAKFDVVHCGAAVEEVPMWMLDALAPGGRLVVPIGPTDSPQVLTLVTKHLVAHGSGLHSETDSEQDGSDVVQFATDRKEVEYEYKYKPLIDVLYVPLTSNAHQRERDQNWDEVVTDCRHNSDTIFAERQAFSQNRWTNSNQLINAIFSPLIDRN